jgi:hypothetical protein
VLQQRKARADLNQTTNTNHKDLSRLTQESKTTSHRELTRQIENHQEALILSLCGPRYSRGHPYKRGSTYTKKLTTPLGTIQFNARRAIHRATGKTTTPILGAMGVRRRRYSRDVRFTCAEYAAKMSYLDASLMYRTGTGVYVPKRTIHMWVLEIAPSLLDSYLESREERMKTGRRMVLCDSTDVRGLGHREMNQVRLMITGDGELECLRVNEPWPRVEVVTSDGEPGLDESVNWGRRQMCVLHAVKRLGFLLWRDGVSLVERRTALDAVRRPLFTLVASVKRHLVDGDVERLRRRTLWAREELAEAAVVLRRGGHLKAAEYLEVNVDVLLTFAELAVEGVEVPYTTNRVERSMGEVAKRCKHRWMHWGTEGLRCVLIFMLVRYCDGGVFERFRNTYIHNWEWSTC